MTKSFGTSGFCHRVNEFFTLWVVTQYWLVVNNVLGQICCPKTSLTNYQSVPCNIPEKRRPHKKWSWINLSWTDSSQKGQENNSNSIRHTYVAICPSINYNTPLNTTWQNISLYETKQYYSYVTFPFEPPLMTFYPYFILHYLYCKLSLYPRDVGWYANHCPLVHTVLK